MGNNQSGEEGSKVEEFPSLTSDEVKRLRKRSPILEIRAESSTGSEFLSLLRISEFFRFGRLSESFGKMGQIDQI